MISHELRHIWQHTNSEFIGLSPANGFSESLNDIGEIDADAFAIAALAYYRFISLDAASAIICPTEKEHYHDAFEKRVERADDLYKQYFG